MVQYISFGKLEDEQNACYVDGVSITCLSEPITIGFPSDSILCDKGGNNLILDVTISNASYLWQDGAQTPRYEITNSGLYYVDISVDGCTIRDSISVEVQDCEVSLQMPNVFTPNQDGYNDHFTPVRTRGIQEATLRIFNRWGTELHSTDDLSRGWASTGSVSPGTYFWEVEYTDRFGDKGNVRGTVLLLE
jgi:gliding motility-associated-like protein